MLGFKDQYPHIAKLLATAITLPLSTAEVERIFSQLKLIKTDHRNRLNVKTLNNLLMVKLNIGLCDEDTVLQDSAKFWLAQKQRMFVKYL